MKRPLLILLLSIFSLGFSQSQSNIWYFGNKAGIGFSDGVAVPLTNGQLNTIEGCSTISDNSGAILFYTNGQTVWNKNHVAMQNGTGLFGDLSSSQSAMIVPKPGSTSIFYVFTTNAFPTDGGLRYSIVDMTLNAGLGGVTSKNILLYDGTCEKLSVVSHSNGQDLWLVSHKYDSNAFEAHLITNSGISPSTTVSNSGSIVTADSDFANAIGYMKLSPDGTKLAVCHTYLHLVELFDFNAATGLVSNPKIILGDGMHPYGAEFSPSSNALYISAVEEKKLFRFDLHAFDVEASKVLVANFTDIPGALQLGPNGKIYMAMAEQDKLSVISNPNAPADSCELQTNAVDLSGRMCFLGLPSFNQSLFDMKINVGTLCSGNATSVEFDVPQALSTVNWNFGDGTTSTELTPSHIYAIGGTYTVTATAATSSGPLTLTKTITITSSGIAHTIPNQTLCVGESAFYDLSQNDTSILGGQSTAVFGVAYFATIEDAENHVNMLPDTFPVGAGSATFYAKIYNLSNPACGAITNFTVTWYVQPIADFVSDFVTCDDSIVDFYTAFDLTTKDHEVAGAQFQSPPVFSISYFTNETDAQNNVSAISGLFYNTSNPQTVYARLENFEGGCFDIVAFDLVVQNCGAETFDYPKFFTPNGDGYNDIWEIKSSQDLPNVKISIFDRYGKLLKTMTDTGSWDGTADGYPLPSSDYWFVATGSNGKEFRGHFSVKR